MSAMSGSDRSDGITRVPEWKWQLHRDGGKYVIREVCTKVVAVCETRDEARQWMIDRTEERKRMLEAV